MKTTVKATARVEALNDQYLMNTYMNLFGEDKPCFVRGAGMHLWDAEGEVYLDFLAGIAVCNLGHCHPAVTEAIVEQARTLVHVSNLFYIEPQARLAELLARHSFADRWFFANCGATANEAAIKLARRYWAQKGKAKPEIITFENSFHGRTMATITATAQPKYHEGFEPMLPGFRYVHYNDIDAVRKAVNAKTGAILIEPIQGEGGVRMPEKGFLKALRQLCDENGILLIFDEVQVGCGRTGKLFAYEHFGVTPDIITLAKALGNGFPIGAMGCTEAVSAGLTPGTHASTFGGNPLACAAALATLKTMTQPGFLAKALATGRHFMKALNELARIHSVIVEVRGIGLMIGVELKTPVMPVVQRMLANGVVCGPAGGNTLRFTPPLIASTDECDRVTGVLDGVLRDV